MNRDQQLLKPDGGRGEWQSHFANLPLRLAYKSNIRPAFWDYTSALVYDLSVYQSAFDRFDGEIAGCVAGERRRLWEEMLAAEGRRFIDFFNRTLTELRGLVDGFSETEHQHHGYFFRRQVWNIILHIPFLTQTNLKPRGYPGDSELMQMIYRNDYEGRSTFGRLLHKACVELPAAQSVRNRKRMLVDFIRSLRASGGPPPGAPMRLLSIACGPAFELRDLFGSAADCGCFEVSLMDQDEKALAEAAAVQAEVAARVGAMPPVTFLNASVRTMLLSRRLSETWGRFHFIYALGLFDYLNPPVARALLKRLLPLLEPGGEMLVGNYHVGNVTKSSMDYWADWALLYRTEEEFLGLLPESSDTAARLLFEPTGCQMFLHIRKS
jgi:extracellular factor (EF) 3-hydroxypalmitic acid methyl ester biosynthesis protein